MDQVYKPLADLYLQKYLCNLPLQLHFAQSHLSLLHLLNIQIHQYKDPPLGHSQIHHYKNMFLHLFLLMKRHLLRNKLPELGVPMQAGGHVDSFLGKVNDPPQIPRLVATHLAVPVLLHQRILLVFVQDILLPVPQILPPLN